MMSYCQCLQRQHLRGGKIDLNDVCVPITTKDPVYECTLNGFNVTRKALDNLVTDMVSPITLPIPSKAQTGKSLAQIEE